LTYAVDVTPQSLPFLRWKERIMRRYWGIAAAVVAVLALAVTAVGDSGANLILAKIPFEFVVGDQPYPAGEYLALFPVPSHVATLSFGSRSAGTHTVYLATGSDPRVLDSRASMDFRHYRYEDLNGAKQEAYFLFRINAGYGIAGREIPKGAAERAIEREANRRNGGGSAQVLRPEIVSVAASR
jgi:hypothetical protein